MKNILYRGKRKGNESNEWVDGFYVCLNQKAHRIYTGYAETDCGDYYPELFEVIPETIGQYTGLIDKNGVKIFEGDIVRYNGEKHIVVFETRGETGYFGIKIDHIETWGFCLYVPAKLMEVIGNIYDNSELLKGE